jgi:hypothetical protein
MNKLLLLLLAACLSALATPLSGQTQHIQWGLQHKSKGNRGAVTGQKITTDKQGNLYTFGIYNDTLVLGGGTSPFINAVQSPNAAGQYEFFITKTDTDSNLVWVKKFDKHTFKLNHSYNGPYAASIVVDDSSNVYIAGSFPGTIDVDPGSGTHLLAARDSTLVIAKDAFVVKMSTDGELTWVKHFTKNVTPLFATFNRATDIRMGGLELDNTGKLYASGVLFDCQAGDSVFFDPAGAAITKTFTNATAKHIPFWISMEAGSGNFDEVHVLPNSQTGGVMNFALKPDNRGNLYASGSFNDSVDFDFQQNAPYILNALTPGTLRYNVFIAKYDTAGTIKWAYSMPSPRSYYGDFSIDPSGNVLVTGGFLDSIKIQGNNGAPYTFYNKETAFVSKYDSTGDVAWANMVDLALAEDKKVTTSGITSDAFDQVYLTGSVNGRFNITPITFQTYDHAFIQRLKADGTQDWLMRFGTIPFIAQQAVFGLDVHVDESNNLYTSGTLRRQPINLSPLEATAYTIEPGTKDNNYLAKYFCKDTASSHHQVTACNEYNFYGVTYTQSGIYKKKYWSAGGCDSIVTLELTINNIDEPFITVNNFELGVTSAYDSYQWLLNNALINNATGSTHIATVNGAYRVIAGLANGCKDTSDAYTVTNVTAIQEAGTLASSINCYPNPSYDFVQVNSPVALKLALFTIDGKNIIPAAGTNKVSVKGLAEGIYLLHITDRDGNLIKVEKIIKHK